MISLVVSWKKGCRKVAIRWCRVIVIESVEKFQSEVRKNGRFKSAYFVLKVHFNIKLSIWLNLCSLGNSQQEVIFSGRLRAGLIVMRQKLTNAAFN